MAYMAVGSRQALFSDAVTPSAARDDAREVANLSDNSTLEASRTAAAPTPENERVTNDPRSSGQVVDVLA